MADGNKEVHPSLQEEFELAYHDVVIQYVSHYASETPSDKDLGIKSSNMCWHVVKPTHSCSLQWIWID